MILYAIQNIHNPDEFMGYDNRGAMATGYPCWFSYKNYPDRIHFFEQFVYAAGHLSDALRLETQDFKPLSARVVKLVIEIQPGEGIKEQF